MSKNDDAPPHVIERLRGRLDHPESGCWIFTGALANGYGRITWSDGSKMIYGLTHRVMYVAERGTIPEGFDLDHLCRVRNCCNPAHLEPVTRQENLLRGDTIPARRAAVTHCPRGHEYAGDNLFYDKKGRRGCRECRREFNREYARKNRDRKAEYNKRYWAENRERLLEYHREYRVENRDRLLEYDANRRADRDR